MMFSSLIRLVEQNSPNKKCIKEIKKNSFSLTKLAETFKHIEKVQIFENFRDCVLLILAKGSWSILSKFKQQRKRAKV